VRSDPHISSPGISRPPAAAGDALRTYAEWRLGVARGLFSAEEIVALAAEADRLAQRRPDTDPGPLRYRTAFGPDGRRRVDTVNPVADLSALYAGLNADPRLAGFAEAALGEPATVLRERLTIRWPGCSGRRTHCDAVDLEACGVPARDVVIVLLALDRTSVIDGTTEFFPGLRTGENAPSIDGYRTMPDDEVVEGEWSLMPELSPGDVAIFDALMPHRAGVNESPHPRRSYEITFASARHRHCRTRYYQARAARSWRPPRD
jgi:hypothetical protein